MPALAEASPQKAEVDLEGVADHQSWVGFSAQSVQATFGELEFMAIAAQEDQRKCR